VYASPNEAIDDPRRWGEEAGYFGLAPTPAPAPARPAWQTALEQIIPVAVSLATQRRLDKLQLKREEAGLPPLTSEQIREQMAPAARIEHSIAPVGWQAYAIPAAVVAGILGLFFLTRKG
jgi:hypothetical protein